MKKELMSRFPSLEKYNDRTIAIAVFFFFFLLYRFRYTEFLGDGGSIIWEINDAIAKGKPAIFINAHWLETYFFQLWVYFCDFFSLGVVPLDDPATTYFASNLNRITMLNSLLGPAMLSITYLFTRAIGGVKSSLLIALCLYGASTSTWMLSTCAERQIMALFFSSLAFLSTTGLRTLRLAWFIIASLLSSALIVLMTLIYLPMIMFIPVFILLIIREIKGENNKHTGFLNSFKFRMGIFLFCFIAVDYLFNIVSGMSFSSIIHSALNYLKVFGATSNTAFLYRFSWEFVVNNLFCGLGYFALWVFSWGVHKINLAQINNLQYGLGYFGALVSISLFLFVIFNAISAIRRIDLIAKLKKADKHTLYRCIFGIYIIIGIGVIFLTRQGYTSEYWSYVLWGMIPLLGLKERPLFGINKREMGYFIVSVLLAFNFITGWDNFFNTDFISRNPNIRFTQDMAVLANNTRPGDVYLAYSLHGTYWAPLITNNQVDVVSIDMSVLSGVQFVLAKAYQEKGRVFILKEIFYPEKYHKDYFKNLGNNFADNQLWLQEHYYPSGEKIEQEASIGLITFLEILRYVEKGAAEVTFIKEDTTSHGNWKASYGAGGYIVIQDEVSYPPYAEISVLGSYDPYRWTDSTSEIRALQKANSQDRLMACWYANDSLAIDLNLKDDQTHRVAFYFADYADSGRKQIVNVLDAKTNAVLSTWTLSDFSNGKYLVWDIKGHVKIILKDIVGFNSVVSGLFFGNQIITN